MSGVWSPEAFSQRDTGYKCVLMQTLVQYTFIRRVTVHVALNFFYILK